MKGLLIKDFRLMKGQVKTIVFVVAIAVLFSLPTGNYQFFLAYLTLFSITFCTGTISYDEFDKGYSYLFTLPISRKGYVREKYILGLIMVTLSCGGGTLLTLLQSVLRPDDLLNPAELFVEVSAIWLLGYVALACMLPTYLKFGAEKGRMVSFLVYLGIGAVVVGPILFARKIGVNFSVLTRSLRRVPLAVWAAATALLALALLLAVSVAVSCRIMERKEF